MQELQRRDSEGTFCPPTPMHHKADLRDTESDSPDNEYNFFASRRLSTSSRSSGSDQASVRLAPCPQSKTAGELVIDIILQAESIWPGRRPILPFGSSFFGEQTSMGAGSAGRAGVLKVSENLRRALRYNQRYVVIKRPNEQGAPARAYCESLDVVLREMRVLGSMAMRGHGNVVRLLGMYWESDADVVDRPLPVLVLQHAAGGDVMGFLSAQLEVSYNVRKVIAVQVADALAHIHSCCVAHTDLGPNQVLVTRWSKGDVHIVLADFEGAVAGSSLEDERDLITGHGNWTWAAPEQVPLLQRFSREGLVTRQIRDYQAMDVYSFGLCAAAIMLPRPETFLHLFAKRFGGETFAVETTAFLESEDLQRQAVDCFNDFKSSENPQLKVRLKMLLQDAMVVDADREEVFQLLDHALGLDPELRDLRQAVPDLRDLQQNIQRAFHSAGPSPISLLHNINTNYPVVVQRSVLGGLVTRFTQQEDSDELFPLLIDLLARRTGSFDQAEFNSLLQRILDSQSERGGADSLLINCISQSLKSDSGLQDFRDDLQLLKDSVTEHRDLAALCHIRTKFPEEYLKILDSIRLDSGSPNTASGTQVLDPATLSKFLHDILRIERGDSSLQQIYRQQPPFHGDETALPIRSPKLLLDMAVLQNCPSVAAGFAARPAETQGDSTVACLTWVHDEDLLSAISLASKYNLADVLQALMSKLQDGSSMAKVKLKFCSSRANGRRTGEQKESLLHSALDPKFRIERMKYHGRHWEQAMSTTIFVLMDKGADPSDVSEGADIIYLAATLRYPQLIHAVQQARPNLALTISKTRRWRIAVIRSVLNGDVDLFLALRACAPKKIHHIRYHGHTILHLCAQAGHRNMALVKTLCAHYPALIERRDQLDLTPAISAILSGFYDMASHLIDAHSTDLLYVVRGESMLARMIQNLAVTKPRLQYFLSRIPPLTDPPTTVKFWPALKRNPFHALASATFDALHLGTLRGLFGALQNSAHFRNPVALKRAVNEEDWMGLTPLMLAVWHGHSEIVEELLRCGADVRHKGCTTAITAARLSKRWMEMGDVPWLRRSDWERVKLRGELRCMDKIVNELVRATRRDLHVQPSERERSVEDIVQMEGRHVNAARVLLGNPFHPERLRYYAQAFIGAFRPQFRGERRWRFRAGISFAISFFTDTASQFLIAVLAAPHMLLCAWNYTCYGGPKHFWAYIDAIRPLQPAFEFWGVSWNWVIQVVALTLTVEEREEVFRDLAYDVQEVRNNMLFVVSVGIVVTGMNWYKIKYIYWEATRAFKVVRSIVGVALYFVKIITLNDILGFLIAVFTGNVDLSAFRALWQLYWLM